MSLRHLFYRTLITIDELRNAVREVCSSKDQRSRADAQTVLEQRVMLSASPLAVSPDSAPALADAEGVPAELTFQQQDDATVGQSETAAAEQDFRQIVFLDTRLESLAAFEQSPLHEQLADHVRLVMLEADRDGIEQITEVLAEHTGMEAIHIVSHGDHGQIQLGGSLLSADSLDGYAGQIASWQSALSSDADILFYGCNVAADAEGQLLVDSISALTEADVAASDDVTGHTDLGGDWEFEYSAGSVETEGVFSLAVQQNWYETLAVTIVVDTTVDDAAGHGNYGDTSSFTALLADKGDDGRISLREAIDVANNQVGTDTIEFEIADALVGGVHTINLSSALSAISDTVVLDATTDGDFADAPIIVLNGAAAGVTADGLRLIAGSDGSTIRGLNIQQFGDEGILVNDSDGHTIVGNWIGLSADGTSDQGNGGFGIEVYESAGLTIGGSTAADRNVISGNDGTGIILFGSSTTSNIVQGNYIGTNATGTAAVGNSSDGISLDGGASGNTIGGDRAVGQGNVLSGNLNDGLEIGNAGTDNNLIYGNYIGTNFDGTSALGNARHGVVIYNGVQGTQVGGTGTGQGNIISGNADAGIVIDGNSVATTSGNLVQANYIGADVTGMLDLGNATDGIVIKNGAQGNTIGGPTAAHRNIISGNNNDGIWITGSNTDSNVVQGNWIGLDAAGGALGNSYHGIGIENGVANNLIGGTDSGEGNTIAYNAWDGIAVGSTTGTGNAALGNEFIGNGNLAIDLEGGTEDGFSVTANDTSDGDTGPNDLQNYPDITQADLSGTDLTVSGSLDTDGLNTQYRIEFFGSASGSEDGSGHGEGGVYLGATTVTTDGSGDAAFSGVTLTSVTLGGGDYVTATATRVDDAGQVGTNDLLAYGDTSEMAANFVVTATNTPPSDLAATLTAEGGLSINQDGGNDAYFIADDGDQVFGGRTALTVEVRFSMDSIANGTHFLSYATTTDNDTFRFNIGTGGEFRILVNGSFVQSNAMDYSTLADGEQHSLAVTWDSSGGLWEIFVDGALVDSGSGHRAGEALYGGGTLVVGNEQDGIDVGYDTASVLSATLYDVRVFDTVRSDAQIAANYRSTLLFDESGMVANWTFSDLSAAGVTTETVSGNNLTLKHVAEPGFTASNPGLHLVVDEGARNGTAVGTVAATDTEREALIASLLAADPNLVFSAETGKFYKHWSGAGHFTTATAGAGSQLLNGVGGELATIHSAVDNSAVFEAYNAAGASAEAWLGGTDATVEGEWRWQSAGSDGDSFWIGTASGHASNGAYTNFRGVEPNDSGGEDYLVMFSDGGWNDGGVSQASDAMLQWDADSVLDHAGPTGEQPLTYSIQSQTVAGAFTVDADSGQITVANGSLLDYETHASHTVTIRVTDVDGNTYDEAFAIALNDLVESNNAPTDLSSGIELNTDGGNDAYLQTTTDLIAGLSSVTVETSFRVDQINGDKVALVDFYSTSGIDDELMVRLASSGEIEIGIGDVNVTSTNQYSSLLDGQQHHVAFSWDADGGVWAVYVDGEFAESGSGLRSGTLLSAGTYLGIGQTFDDAGDSDAIRAFSGAFYDVRLWNEVRSEAEIALNYQQKLDVWESAGQPGCQLADGRVQRLERGRRYRQWQQPQCRACQWDRLHGQHADGGPTHWRAQR